MRDDPSTDSQSSPLVATLLPLVAPFLSRLLSSFPFFSLFFPFTIVLVDEDGLKSEKGNGPSVELLTIFPMEEIVGGGEPLAPPPLWNFFHRVDRLNKISVHPK